MAQISILGAGTWGTSLALLLYNNQHTVSIWSATAREEKLTDLRDKHRHPNLTDVQIPEDIKIVTDLEEAMMDAEILVLAVPSLYIRETAKRMSPWLKKQIIITVSKGIEAETLMTLSEQIEDELPAANVAVLSGPSHAEEVSHGLPTSCVIGARDEATASYLQSIFMSSAFRVYRSPDILGIELGGSLKNVIALAAGMADGLGYGDNTKAALITRGLAEIARLAIKMGGKSETLYGLSGMGDLIVTCASMHSRNRRAGILMGQGKTMDEAMKEVNMVVEGVHSAKAALTLARKYQVQMPIVSQVNAILFERKSAESAVSELMLRDGRIEHADLPWPE